MNIIVAGAGKVGSTLARQLCAEGHDLTVIDRERRVITACTESFDAMGVQGNCANMETLLQAGIQEADLLIAATGQDEVNLLCCLTARGLNHKLHTIARIRDPEYTDQVHKMQELFSLSMTVNPDRQAAVEIERLLKYPGFLRRDTFAKGRTEIVELRVGPESKLKDVTLMDLNGIVKCQVLVCAVLREGKVVIPSGNFVLRQADRVFVTASTQNLTLLLKNLGVITRRVRQVMILGGSRISVYLTQFLEKEGIDVRLIESDPAKCARLAELLPDASIICGDGSNPNVLDSEGMGECDALVSLTGQDELNMIVSLYASSQGMGQVITKLAHIKNHTILDSLSLGSVIRPVELCSNAIVRYVRAMQNHAGAAISVHSIADGQVEAMEFLVDETTPSCGVPLKQMKLRPNVLIACINSQGRTIIPNGDSFYRQGDIVVVVTSDRSSLRQLTDIFRGNTPARGTT